LKFNGVPINKIVLQNYQTLKIDLNSLKSEIIGHPIAVNTTNNKSPEE
jgi:hypothetical protein